MGLVHEFKKFVDHGLEELPMCLEEPRVLTNNVHDIGSDDRFVVFSAFDLTQPEEIFNYRHQETFFRLFV